MKRFLPVPVLLAVLVFLAGCFSVPDGFVSREENYDPHPGQDHIDYCIWVYGDASAFESGSDFRQVGEEDVKRIRGYFENFTSVWNSSGRTGEWEFDPGCVSPGDFVRVSTKEGEPIGEYRYGVFDDYSVYFFDSDALVLYYIHSNI